LLDSPWQQFSVAHMTCMIMYMCSQDLVRTFCL
jgi:hypothetical protein